MNDPLRGRANPDPGGVNLLAVARRAGVSLSTASRALNGSTRTVGAALGERVRRAAEELDYSPNLPAQATARGGTNVVSIVVPDIADPYFATIAAGVMRAAEPHGLIITLSSTGNRPEHEVDHVSSLRGQRARGVIIVGSRTTDAAQVAALGAEVARLRESGVRVAAISQPVLPVDTVVIENRAGARALATALAGLGYRRFAVLAGPRELVTARDRLAGFRAGLRAAGVALRRSDTVFGEFTRDGGYAAAGALLAAGPMPRCVFAVNDVMAVGAMARFREAGLRLPEDVAVAGFDDIAGLRDIAPALTTVRIPLAELGERALEFVLSGPVARREHAYAGEVVLRASTPPLP